MDSILCAVVKVILFLAVCAGGLGLDSVTSPPPKSGSMMSDSPFSAVSEYLEEYGCDKAIRNRTTIIQDCLRRTVHFFHKYLNRLDKGKQYDVCRRFQDIRNCLEPVLESCSDFRAAYLPTLQPILDYFTCVCDEAADCIETLQCFEVEYRGVMLRRCDDYYRYNLQQKTHHSCYFLQENIDCKVALVTTACDSRTGDFAYYLYKFLALHDFKTARCRIHPTIVEQYRGFSYDANCPTYFLQDLASCSTNHLRSHMVQFDEENDLIARGDPHDVKNACRHYKNYRKCIRHPRKACKAGTKEVFNYGTNLRKYALKMNYICKGTNKKDYIEALPCYQELLSNLTLEQCDFVYTDLKPLLHSVSAFQFYCKEDSDSTTSMKYHLDRLRSCYQDIFTNSCGIRSGEMMNDLIDYAFQDPAYLRYSYKPDCRLHRKSNRLKGGPVTEDPGTSKSASGSSSVQFHLSSVRTLWVLTVALTRRMWLPHR